MASLFSHIHLDMTEEFTTVKHIYSHIHSLAYNHSFPSLLDIYYFKGHNLSHIQTYSILSSQVVSLPCKFVIRGCKLLCSNGHIDRSRWTYSCDITGIHSLRKLFYRPILVHIKKHPHNHFMSCIYSHILLYNVSMNVHILAFTTMHIPITYYNLCEYN